MSQVSLCGLVVGRVVNGDDEGVKFADHVQGCSLRLGR